MGVSHIRSFGPVGGAGLAALAAFLLGGCASPANPRAPSLHLEEIAAPLEAVRLGDQVMLTWTTPAATTDGGRPDLPLTAVLCRESVTPAQTACAPLLRLATAPGAAGSASDTLPPALLGSRSLVAYRLEIQNRRGRAAGFSEPAFAAAGSAPAPAGRLTVSGRAAGALITWPAASSSGAMELTRTAVVPPAPAGNAPGAGSAHPAAFAADPAAPVVLRPAPGTGPAANGMVDVSVLDPRAEGTAFRYVGQRVESVTLAGHALELRGLPSAPVVFTYAHVFPPAVPAGLIAVPALTPPALDLSWEVDASPDLLGYNVYRRGAGERDFTLLTAKPIPIPSFRDAGVEAGRAYTYRVTALDRHHNQSAPSVEVKESVTP